MPNSVTIDVASARLKASTREQVFEKLSALVATHTSYPQQKIVNRLIEKEAVSISGVGNGVAIPHLKIRGLERRMTALVTLNKAVDFRALDDKFADIVCLLLSPESHGGLHLRGLSRISRLLRNEELCQNLREAKDAETLKSFFSNPDGWLLAA